MRFLLEKTMMGFCGTWGRIPHLYIAIKKRNRTAELRDFNLKKVINNILIRVLL